MGVILCEFESRPPHPSRKEEISKEVSSFSFYVTALGNEGNVVLLFDAIPGSGAKVCV